MFRVLPLAVFVGCSSSTPKEDDPTVPTDSPSPTDTADTDTPNETNATDTPETGDTGGSETGTTGDTGASPPVVLSASCALTANALRVSCTATMSAEAEITLTLTAYGADTRVFTSPSAVEHEILGWGLLPDTTYDWAIGEQVGTVTTASLPQELADASIIATGTSWGFDAVLYPMACPGSDWFTLVDGQGRIVWYEPNDVFFFGSMTGYEWSQASKSVLSVNDGRFLEQHVSGDILLELDENTHFDADDRLHHDTERWGDYRYLLFEYPYTSGPGGLYVDGIHVFEGDVLLGTFDLADHFTISGGSGDWSHANGINVTETGEIVLSLLQFDTVLGIDGDPASPTFLDLLWIASGDATSELPNPDYLPIVGPGEGFDGQHNASRHGDELWLFDNRSQPDSRAARYLMDEALGTLTLTGAWSFDTICTNQGGSLPLEGGGVLATCANSDLVWAFQETSTTPDWTLAVDCGGGSGLDITRAIPVFIE